MTKLIKLDAVYDHIDEVFDVCLHWAQNDPYVSMEVVRQLFKEQLKDHLYDEWLIEIEEYYKLNGNYN